MLLKLILLLILQYESMKNISPENENLINVIDLPSYCLDFIFFIQSSSIKRYEYFTYDQNTLESNNFYFSHCNSNVKHNKVQFQQIKCTFTIQYNQDFDDNLEQEILKFLLSTELSVSQHEYYFLNSQNNQHITIKNIEDLNQIIKNYITPKIKEVQNIIS